MPYPRKGQTKDEYLKLFMSSPEAIDDFSDPKQRIAVAHSLWEKRNATPSYGKSMPWPKAFKCNYLESGVVHYQDLGGCSVCGDSRACGNNGDECKLDGETILLPQDAIERMQSTFVGKPVCIDHQDVESSTVADGEADGIVTRVWIENGWAWCDFLVWGEEAQKKCESGTFSVSCAYEPSDVDESGGEYHSIPYASTVKDGVLTHLAIVSNPRYEAARIYKNAKLTGGKKMAKTSWWDKMTGRKNSLPVDLKEKINVDGKDVPMKELLDALEPEKPKFNDDSVFETAHGEKSLADLKNAYRNKMKNSALAPEGEEEDPTKGAAKADAGHAMKDNAGDEKELESCEHCNGTGKKNAGEPVVEKPLPDMRDPKANDAAEEAAKKLDAETKEKKALELEQSKEDALAAKAKEDAEAKKNAEEIELTEKRNAGRRAFAALQNARDAGDGVVENIAPVGLDERLARGKAKYGKSA